MYMISCKFFFRLFLPFFLLFISCVSHKRTWESPRLIKIYWLFNMILLSLTYFHSKNGIYQFRYCTAYCLCVWDNHLLINLWFFFFFFLRIFMTFFEGVADDLTIHWPAQYNFDEFSFYSLFVVGGLKIQFINCTHTHRYRYIYFRRILWNRPVILGIATVMAT